jgi:hypothetical protein
MGTEGNDNAKAGNRHQGTRNRRQGTSIGPVFTQAVISLRPANFLCGRTICPNNPMGRVGRVSWAQLAVDRQGIASAGLHG